MRKKGVPFAVNADFSRVAILETEGTSVVVKWHDANLEKLHIDEAQAKAAMESLRAPKDEPGQYSL